MKVILQAELGELFGETWDLDVSSPAEAIRAIGFQKPGFFDYLNTSGELGNRYSVVTGENLRELATADELLELAEDQIIFSPIIEGESGSPILRGLLGVALVGVALFIPGVGAGVGLMGASLIAGGIAEVLSPQQKKSSDPANRENNIIDRAAQVIQQGARVPIGYGYLQLNDLIPISSGVTDETLIQVQDDYAIYRRVTEIELPYNATAVHQYTYFNSSKNFRQLNTDFLKNNDPYSGMVVNRSPFGEMGVKINFSTSPQGLNIRMAYAIQRLRIFSWAEGFAGATNFNVYDGGYNHLFAGNLNNGWTEFYLGGLGQFNEPRDTYYFHFYQQNTNIDHICVGELQLFGTIGLSENVGDIRA
jgi:predicted phage tail protein